MMKAVSSPVAMVLQQRWVTSYLRIGVVGKRPRRSSVKSYYLLRPKAETKTKASHTQWLKITKLSLIMDKLTEFNQWVLLFETLETWRHLALKINDYFLIRDHFWYFLSHCALDASTRWWCSVLHFSRRRRKNFLIPIITDDPLFLYPLHAPLLASADAV